jgi:hypothetical protein
MLQFCKIIYNSDEYFEEAGRFIIEKKKASIDVLQQAFRISFNHAAQIMDNLSDAGVVGPEKGTKEREIIMDKEQFHSYLSYKKEKKYEKIYEIKIELDKSFLLKNKVQPTIPLTEKDIKVVDEIKKEVYIPKGCNIWNYKIKINEIYLFHKLISKIEKKFNVKINSISSNEIIIKKEDDKNNDLTLDELYKIKKNSKDFRKIIKFEFDAEPNKDNEYQNCIIKLPPLIYNISGINL